MRRVEVAPVTAKTILARLRKSLGADGYYAFAMSKYHRKSIDDFVAVYKDNLRHFLLVHREGERIVVKPFGLLKNSIPAKWTVEELILFHNAPIRFGAQVPSRRKNLQVEHFLQPEQRRELALLSGQT